MLHRLMSSIVWEGGSFTCADAGLEVSYRTLESLGVTFGHLFLHMGWKYG